jgi:Flp pilus assembly protein protease CpaA
MEFGFLFWLFGIGIVVASMQDLKRREVDNWLNLFLLVSSFVFIFYKFIFEGDSSIIFQAGFALVLMFGIMNLFYYGRVFAGGDAKLLVAMTAFFIGVTFYLTLINIGTFLLFLMLSGSVYGLLYSLVLYFKDFDKVNKEMGRLAKVLGFGWWVFGGIGFVLMLFGFISFIFFLLGVLILAFPLLIVFARGLESVSMIREVSGLELKEGDWLVSDVIVYRQKTKNKMRRIIRADWDGLSLEDIELLKNKKKVLIKEGLPFVPAFLIAFIGYVVLHDWFIGLFVF